jgi:hypothetical protein
MAKPTVVVTRLVPREALELLEHHFVVDASDVDRAYTPQELASHAGSTTRSWRAARN